MLIPCGSFKSLISLFWKTQFTFVIIYYLTIFNNRRITTTKKGGIGHIMSDSIMWWTPGFSIWLFATGEGNKLCISPGPDYIFWRPRVQTQLEGPATLLSPELLETLSASKKKYLYFVIFFQFPFCYSTSYFPSF